MNKFQPTKFNFWELLDVIPTKEREIIDLLRKIVLEILPECMEKLAYNVPFYYRHSRICFIWPASIPSWGEMDSGVVIGFCNGHLLSDDTNYFEKGDQKNVFSKTFTSDQEIETDLLKSYLF